MAASALPALTRQCPEEICRRRGVGARVGSRARARPSAVAHRHTSVESCLWQRSGLARVERMLNLSPTLTCLPRRISTLRDACRVYFVRNPKCNGNHAREPCGVRRVREHPRASISHQAEASPRCVGPAAAARGHGAAPTPRCSPSLSLACSLPPTTSTRGCVCMCARKASRQVLGGMLVCLDICLHPA